MSTLSDFRPEGVSAPAPAKSTRKVWTPPNAAIYPPDIWLLAFDPSITACGYVFVRTMEKPNVGQELVVLEADKIGRESEGDSSLENKLQRATQVSMDIQTLVSRARSLLWEWNERAPGRHGRLVITHEMPPAGGGHLRSPESAMMISMAVRIAAERESLPVSMIHAQSAKYIVTGDRKATKNQVKDALLSIPNVIHADRCKNEATRDALAVAHGWFADKDKH